RFCARQVERISLKSRCSSVHQLAAGVIYWPDILAGATHRTGFTKQVIKVIATDCLTLKQLVRNRFQMVALDADDVSGLGVSAVENFLHFFVNFTRSRFARVPL